MPKGLKRARPSKKLGKKILIACEGSKTEPIYFKAIRQELRLSTLDVIVLHNNKSDPRSIIELAIETRKEIKKDKGWSKGDTAWAVFDGDEHIEKSPTSWRSALDRARSQDIHLAITNPCFELWYLIHYQDHLAQINRDKILDLLNKHLPSYDKGLCFYPEPLAPLTAHAIQRAERIAAQIKRDGLHEHSNPCCSKLPELVKNLLSSRKL